MHKGNFSIVKHFPIPHHTSLSKSMLVHAAHFMLCTAFKSSPSEKTKPTHLFLLSYEMCFTQRVTQQNADCTEDNPCNFWLLTSVRFGFREFRHSRENMCSVPLFFFFNFQKVNDGQEFKIYSRM